MATRFAAFTVSYMESALVGIPRASIASSIQLRAGNELNTIVDDITFRFFNRSGKGDSAKGEDGKESGGGLHFVDGK